MAESAQVPSPELTLEDRKRAFAWLAKQGASTACPSCGTSEWSLGRKFVELPVMTPVGQASAVYPAVMFVCTNCAFMRLHSAHAMGLTDPDIDGWKREEAADGA